MTSTESDPSNASAYIVVLPDKDGQPPAYESLPPVTPRDPEPYSYTICPRPDAVQPTPPVYAETDGYCGPDPIVGRYTNGPRAQPEALYSTPVAADSDNHLYTQRLQQDEHELNEYDYPQPSPPAVPPTEGRRQVQREAPVSNQQVMHPPAPKVHKSRTWLAWSIVNLIILCLPLGIPATILSALAASDYKKGKYSSAERKAKAAFVLNIIGTVCGGLIIFTIVGGVVFALGVCAYCSAASSSY